MTRRPGPVTAATTVAAALVGLLAWAAAQMGVEAPPEVQGYATVLLVFLVGWAAPPSSRSRAREALEDMEAEGGGHG